MGFPFAQEMETFELMSNRKFLGYEGYTKKLFMVTNQVDDSSVKQDKIPYVLKQFWLSQPNKQL